MYFPNAEKFWLNTKLEKEEEARAVFGEQQLTLPRRDINILAQLLDQDPILKSMSVTTLRSGLASWWNSLCLSPRQGMRLLHSAYGTSGRTF